MLPIRDFTPTRRFPALTVSIIVVNIITFAYELLAEAGGTLEQTFYTMGVVPFEVIHNFGPSVALSFLTSMFLHGGFMHIAGNMLYLWIFGNNVEDSMGRGRFLVFYLLTGSIASAAQVLASPNSRLPTIGASGAIAGVLGAYIVLFPRARIQTLLFLGYFVRMTHLPALLVLGFWFVLQLFNGLLALGVAQVGGVAWFAHIGGFVAGLLLVRLFTLGRRQNYWEEW
ncbi:MAG: rhomboid family intramembrane serine protease [Chloroflexi bacterium]|nr:rhomboid family intramembrane serine protease [Chloroflexota bacterium]